MRERKKRGVKKKSITQQCFKCRALPRGNHPKQSQLFFILLTLVHPPTHTITLCIYRSCVSKNEIAIKHHDKVITIAIMKHLCVCFAAAAAFVASLYLLIIHAPVPAACSYYNINNNPIIIRLCPPPLFFLSCVCVWCAFHLLLSIGLCASESLACVFVRNASFGRQGNKRDDRPTDRRWWRHSGTKISNRKKERKKKQFSLHLDIGFQSFPLLKRIRLLLPFLIKCGRLKCQ